jgi:TRAP-type uncharacterized transport system substrate-binding protein
MLAGKKLLQIWWAWLAPAVGVAALILALYFLFHTPQEQHYRLTMSAGESGTTRSKLAEALQAKAGARGLTLEFRETSGSEDMLEQLNRHTLDVAFVQGGVHIENATKVRQVATLQIEPLHLLLKKELAEDVTANWDVLEGKTVNLGPPGSGTHLLAREVMEFVGLYPQEHGKKGGYVPTVKSHRELAAEKDRAKLPDAAFMVASLPSETGKYLVHRHDYLLVPLPFADAFALDGLNATRKKAKHVEQNRIDRGRIYATTIPAFTYRVEPHVPDRPLPSLGTRLLVVAHRDVDTTAVQRLVEVIYGSEFASVTRPALEPKLLDLPPEFPWHAGTQHYRARNAPIVSGSVLDAAHKGAAILAAAASGLFVLWQWLRLRRKVHRDRGFSSYMNAVTRIEEKASQIERDQMGGLQQLLELRDELSRVKTEALDKFTAGELAGDDLLQGFLVEVHDVRDHLTHLIDWCDVPTTTEVASVAPVPVTKGARKRGRK